ncbi:MAG: hypothetical protein MRY64_16795 [Hyphomonadaceae bacterium]|nr:hypothetical protein [Hyphomonadaceae bacterium]
MTGDVQTEAELLDLIEAYGADLAAWPEDLADAARAWLEHPSPVVRAALEEAVSLDAMLAELPQVEPPAHLARAILDQAPQPAKAPEGARTWLSWLQMPARTGAALASLAVGLSVGFGTAAASAPAGDDFDTVMSQALGYELAGEVSDLWELPE